MSKYSETLAHLEQHVNQAQINLHQFTALEHIINMLEACFPNMYLSTSGSWAHVSISDQPGFTAVDNPELLETIEWLESHMQFIECVDTPKDALRIYRFSTGMLDFSLFVYLADDAICRCIITGYDEVEENRTVTITVAKPRYEFNC